MRNSMRKVESLFFRDPKCEILSFRHESFALLCQEFIILQYFQSMIETYHWFPLALPYN